GRGGSEVCDRAAGGYRECAVRSRVTTCGPSRERSEGCVREILRPAIVGVRLAARDEHCEEIHPRGEIGVVWAAVEPDVPLSVVDVAIHDCCRIRLAVLAMVTTVRATVARAECRGSPD